MSLKDDFCPVCSRASRTSGPAAWVAGGVSLQGEESWREDAKTCLCQLCLRSGGGSSGIFGSKAQDVLLTSRGLLHVRTSGSSVRWVLRAGNGAGVCEARLLYLLISYLSPDSPSFVSQELRAPGLTWVIAMASQILSLLCLTAPKPDSKKCSQTAFQNALLIMSPSPFQTCPPPSLKAAPSWPGGPAQRGSPVTVPQGACACEEGSPAKPPGAPTFLRGRRKGKLSQGNRDPPSAGFRRKAGKRSCHVLKDTLVSWAC